MNENGTWLARAETLFTTGRNDDMNVGTSFSDARRRSRQWAPVLVLLVGAWSAALSRGDEPGPAANAAPESALTSPAARLRSWWHETTAPFAQREAVRMVAAILEGSQMGPGDGWFGPGQSRYGWDWLAGRYDGNRDGAISAEEFTGPTELFERLDRDRDGELAPADFDWSDASPFVRQQGQAGQWFSRIDKSSNGRITPEEWQQFFEKLAGEKGFVSRDDLRAGREC
jgi:hypothetical protein